MNAPLHSFSRRHPGRGERWQDYVPLIALILVSALVASALKRSYGPDANPAHWMHDFMGCFLVVFALLKLFDLPAFADGFQMYDLLAKPFRPYAYVYPFLELALGLAYFSFWQPVTVYLATIFLLGFSALGVARAVWRGVDVECACMGTVLKVPLSTVAFLEDVSMVAMALIMWLRVRFG